MLLDRQLLERTRARDERPPVTVVVGGCGGGRTERLRRVERDLGPSAAQYIDIERVATTPERCYRRRPPRSPFAAAGRPTAPAGARDAFDALLHVPDDGARPRRRSGDLPARRSARLRTFESFPGLRSALRGAGPRARAQPQPLRAQHALRGAGPALGRRRAGPLRRRARRAADAPTTSGRRSAPSRSDDADGPRRAPSRVLVDGHAGYVRALGARWRSCAAAAPPIRSARSPRRMAPDGELAARCRFSYELRLHRARGYGALKAILDVLADGRAADADRHRAAPRSHAGLDQGLPVLAAGRRPRRLRPQALSLRRSAAAPLGPHQPRPARPRRGSGRSARCRSTRSTRLRRRPMRAARAHAPRAARRPRRRRTPASTRASSRSIDAGHRRAHPARRPQLAAIVGTSRRQGLRARSSR